MSEATLSSKNQIVIPAEARRALGAQPGDKLLLVLRGATLIIMQKPELHHATLLGLAKKPYPKRYLKQERDSWK